MHKRGTLAPARGRSVEERFWAKVEKTDTCWNWTAARTSTGYGAFTADKRTHKAHRLAWEYSGKRLDPGMVLDHICHNKLCVNPSHLRQIMHKQNCENKGPDIRTGRSGVRGVLFRDDIGKYLGRVRHHGRMHHAGWFDTLAEAEQAVIALRNQLFTHNDLDRRDAA